MKVDDIFKDLIKRKPATHLPEKVPGCCGETAGKQGFPVTLHMKRLWRAF
ncbi:hypothetical protein [Corynebacterium callunae]|nr:hypothetical protein [Corynebacterium callunae]MCK2199436.1 hypothetical protein [Corynebacterium callunae]